MVLNCLLRHGVDINFSCRNGVCQTCLLKNETDMPLVLGKQLIATDLAAKGYFLPCKTAAQDGMAIAQPDPRDITIPATVISRESLSSGLIKLVLEPFVNVSYQPGQSTYIYNPDGRFFPLYLISNPSVTPYLEYLFKTDSDSVRDSSSVTQWITQSLSTGDEVKISKPFYDSVQTSSLHYQGSDVISGKEPDGGENNLDWDEANYPPPQHELWNILATGNLLKVIIDDFYDSVFEDPLLSPYFHNTTKQRSKEKVYSFYKRVFSGEECYFGDRPRNAHHWMVISDEVFDYRLELLTTCMEKHGLHRRFIDIWRSYENHYRRDIVKTEPRGRRVGSITLPAGGFDYDVLAEGSMCDSCLEPIEKDIRVLYNKRTGHIYCPDCNTVQMA